ncbi:hypothetical protein, partial [Janthinobacterium sp.]|uniref:hypothetical protein n=1 Tax=Janthinobacterium sp. TaxID=1871054 RepID=UPI002635697C
KLIHSAACMICSLSGEYAESDSTVKGRFRHLPYLPMTEPFFACFSRLGRHAPSSLLSPVFLPSCRAIPD